MSGRVLLPPPAPPRRPLPRWMAAPAAVGLVILCSSTLPALLRHGRLATDYERLARQTAAQEQELRRRTRELGAARTDAFAREHALRCLLHPAATGR